MQSLSETLQLDHLWNTLSDCLVELEENADHHAVLVLQPAVEAFFLVHASNQSNSTKSSTQQNETEAHLRNQTTNYPNNDSAENNTEANMESDSMEQSNAMQTDESGSNPQDSTIAGGHDMAPVSPISLFDRYNILRFKYTFTKKKNNDAEL